MFLRNLLFLCFCAVVAAAIGLYVYHTHAYLVWGLLFLCWACYRLKMRADTLFGERSGTSVSIGSSFAKGNETDTQNNAL